MLRLAIRSLRTSAVRAHENPLGLPSVPSAPAVPRMSRGLPIKQKIRGVGRIVLVSSAKGGVGKLTVAVNVAMALARQNKRVGILDADIFGPSVPRLMSLLGEPRMLAEGRLLPLANYGVETMSMGYLLPLEESAVVWRGLMVMKALQQLLFEVEWSPLDYLVVDMPPGTGDTQLTITQQLKVDGAIIVSTPQDIALIDAVKGITMFNKVGVPILGMVQNMSVHVCPNCHHELYIFGSRGAQREAQKHGIEVLASVPLQAEICEQLDLGKPVVVGLPELAIARPYIEVAKRVIERLG